MEKIIRILCIQLLLWFQLQPGFAQDTARKILSWEFSSVEKAGGDYLLSLRANIQSGWKLFSTTMRDDLPNSRVLLDSSTTAKIISIEEKGNLQIKKEPLLDTAEIRYFENRAEIMVSVHAFDHQKDIKGVINFMAIKNDSVIGPESVPF